LEVLFVIFVRLVKNPHCNRKSYNRQEKFSQRSQRSQRIFFSINKPSVMNRDCSRSAPKTG
jgi:hypothetical protein